MADLETPLSGETDIRAKLISASIILGGIAAAITSATVLKGKVGIAPTLFIAVSLLVAYGLRHQRDGDVPLRRWAVEWTLVALVTLTIATAPTFRKPATNVSGGVTASTATVSGWLGERIAEAFRPEKDQNAPARPADKDERKDRSR
jgi:hypothetical protein